MNQLLNAMKIISLATITGFLMDANAANFNQLRQSAEVLSQQNHLDSGLLTPENVIPNPHDSFLTEYTNLYAQSEMSKRKYNDLLKQISQAGISDQELQLLERTYKNYQNSADARVSAHYKMMVATGPMFDEVSQIRKDIAEGHTTVNSFSGHVYNATTASLFAFIGGAATSPSAAYHSLAKSLNRKKAALDQSIKFVLSRH